MQAWNAFLDSLDDQLGREAVSKWLRNLQVVRFDACNLYLCASDSFQVLWFEEHVRHIVERSFANNNGNKIKVYLSITKGNNSNFSGSKNSLYSNRFNQSSQQKQNFVMEFDKIDPYLNMDTFVPLKENLLAYRLLTQLCSEEQTADPKIKLTDYNPIFLYGESGCGKTHLLMSCEKIFRSLNYKVLYIRSQTFIEHVVNALRMGEIQKFREKYRKVDILILDDIHLFSKKGATQEELFHTFNTLHVQGKQIILSANVSPQELQAIEPRLVSRFEWGITIPIQAPTGDGLKNVLKVKAQAMNFAIDSKLQYFICEMFPKVCMACKALEALILRLYMDGRGKGPVRIDEAKYYLSDLIEEQKKQVLTSASIVKAVAGFYGLPINDVLGRSQSRECALPRQIAMYLCRNLMKMPYMKIGRYFSRNHSTVITSIRQISQSMEKSNKELLGAVACITKQLRMS